MAQLANLVRWEWFKTRRRWMPWILLAVSLLFTQLTLWSTYASYRAPISIDHSTSGGSAVVVVEGNDGAPTTRTVSFDTSCDDVFAGRASPEVPSHMIQMIEDFERGCEESLEREREERRDLLRRITLPCSLITALTTAHGFGVILVAIMTASLLGTEFGWGTLRVVLSRGTGRWRFLSAKLVLLAALAAAALAIVASFAAVSGAIVEVLVEEQPPAPPQWAEVATTFFRAWFGLLPYIALAGVVTVVASSSIAGIAAAVGYFFAEYVIAAIFISLFDWTGGVTDYLLGRNVTAWMMGSGHRELPGSFGPAAAVGEFPEMSHAFIVLLAYMASFGVLAFWAIRRKDIAGAGGA